MRREKKEPEQGGIAALGFSARAYNALKRKGIHSVEQLELLEDEDLLNVPGLGRSCLREIRGKIGNPARHTTKLPKNYSIEQVLKMVEREHARAVRMEYVKNPVAYALYKVWKMADGGRG